MYSINKISNIIGGLPSEHRAGSVHVWIHFFLQETERRDNVKAFLTLKVDLWNQRLGKKPEGFEGEAQGDLFGSSNSSSQRAAS